MKNDEDGCQANVPRVLGWGRDGDKELPWPGIGDQDANSPRKHTWRTQTCKIASFRGSLLGLRTKFAKGPRRIIDELLRGKRGGRSDGTPEVFEDECWDQTTLMLFQKRWVFFHNVVCKVRGSLQDDGCRRECCDGREPETFSTARFLGVHGLEQRCRFLRQVSPFWTWMLAVVLELICAQTSLFGAWILAYSCVQGPKLGWKLLSLVRGLNGKWALVDFVSWW